MTETAGDCHREDLAWARELAAGDAEALARYERELVPMIATHLRRRGMPNERIDDVQQALRMRLLVGRGDGAGPAINRYEGRGRLRTWVLVVALREAIRSRQRNKREVPLEDAVLVALAEPTERESSIAEKAQYRTAFRDAFRAALVALEPRDRNLLRMHVLDELSIDQIAKVHGVHRSTAARWVERARERVSRSVRRDLMERLRVDPFELDDLLGWIQSRIDVSLGGLAKTSEGS